jgi:glycosyltransferase involved in cell wall biosynthesis
MRPLRIAWDYYLARQDPAGTGTYAARLLDEFQDRQDMFVEVLDVRRSPGKSKSFLQRRIHTLRNIAWTHIAVPARTWKKGFDLLHAPAFLAPVSSPCPLVITIHDITYLLYPSHFSRWWVIYLKIVMPAATRSAAAILCGSQHSKADIVRTYGLPDHKVHVIPYGVDHQRFHPRAMLAPEWIKQLGLREGYVLHVGTFSYRKNIPTLLRAIAHLRSNGMWGNRQLVLAGSGGSGMKGADEIHSTIRELQLENLVVLAGYVPDEHVPGLYAHAALLVMPSLYEGFGFPVLESMAVGTPVIASNTSSLPEVAGDAAILFPPQDEFALAAAIEEVLHNPTLTAQLRSKGLVRAAEFTWRRTAEETVKIYRSVAGV